MNNSKGFTEVVEKKNYQIKETTRQFLELIESDWVQMLTMRSEIPDLIYNITYAFFLFASDDQIPSLNNKEDFWKFVCQHLEANENDLRIVWNFN